MRPCQDRASEKKGGWAGNVLILLRGNHIWTTDIFYFMKRVLRYNMLKRWNDCSTTAKRKLELVISCNFYHDVILLLTPIINITECYYLVIGNKIRTVDFDVVKMSWSISTAMPVTAITLHHLVWALSIRCISEQATIHISTYPLLELFTIVLQTFLFTLWLL